MAKNGRMTSQKPTGQAGPLNVSPGESGPALSWETIKFSKNKAEIEGLIAKLFVDASARGGSPPFKLEPNEENDYDFTITWSNKKAFLELTEFHYQAPATDDAGPRKIQNSSPYTSGEATLLSYEFARQIFDRVRKKSCKYKRATSTPVHLLVYVTHWQFNPNEDVIQIARHFLQRVPPMFERVVFLRPASISEAELHDLIPDRRRSSRRSLSRRLS